MSLKEYISVYFKKTYNQSNLYSALRGYNRSWNKEMLSEPCIICSYSRKVELHHIKPISTFNENQTIREINDTITKVETDLEKLQKRKIINANSGRARADIQGSKHHEAKILDLSENPVISPCGSEYFRIECIRDFCKLHGINSSCTFGSVLNGKKKSYYGWMLKSVKLSMNKETTIQNSEIENE